MAWSLSSLEWASGRRFLRSQLFSPLFQHPAAIRYWGGVTIALLSRAGNFVYHGETLKATEAQILDTQKIQPMSLSFPEERA
jgi:hypothetical protein